MASLLSFDISQIFVSVSIITHFGLKWPTATMKIQLDSHLPIVPCKLSIVKWPKQNYQVTLVYQLHMYSHYETNLQMRKVWFVKILLTCIYSHQCTSFSHLGVAFHQILFHKLCVTRQYQHVWIINITEYSTVQRTIYLVESQCTQTHPCGSFPVIHGSNRLTNDLELVNILQ